jgi:uncharacterized protein (DUF305 family)
MSNRTRKAAGGVTLLVVAALAVVIAMSAGGHGGHGDSKTANQTDGAFITGMVPHHESAVEMAKIALDKAEHPQITTLAKSIVSSQNKEIDQMTAAHQRLFGEPLPADGKQHGDLGLSEDQMGMSMDASMLKGAKPFDKEFIDMMIPHHQGAIRMARVELAKGDDPEMKTLAKAIITAQSKEINEMNAWRKQWYGAVSPAGGVPSAHGSDSSGGGSMDHGSTGH